MPTTTSRTPPPPPFPRQGVALLPFIDEARLVAATDALLHLLEPEEKFRNSTRLEVRAEGREGGVAVTWMLSFKTAGALCRMAAGDYQAEKSGRGGGQAH